MSEKISVEEGAKLVKTARQEILDAFEGRRKEKKSVLEKKGVFVTLQTFPDCGLRGCIGFPEPIKPLDEALREAAIESAFGDPRFPPLTRNELKHVTIEVNVLTKPMKLEAKTPEEKIRKVIIGRHGLIMRKNFQGGLLLPIVAVEWKWNSKQFLEACCQKAGLASNEWRSEDVEIQVFESQVFKEETPDGKVIEVKLEPQKT